MTPATLLILFLTLGFFGPVIFAFAIMRNPNLVGKGQDAAGKGMAAGCIGILLLILAGAIALADALATAVSWDRIGLVWQIVGFIPIVGGVICCIIFYVAASLASARRIAKDREEAMAIPAALIVDTDDARFLALYNALRPDFPTLEISSRQPGALLWQQGEWFPRLRLLMMSADALAATEGQFGEFAIDLMRAMCRTKPVCPIVLHATSRAVATPIADRLTAAGWAVHPIIMDGPDWVKPTWHDLAKRLLKEQLAARPGPPE